MFLWANHQSANRKLLMISWTSIISVKRQFPPQWPHEQTEMHF